MLLCEIKSVKSNLTGAKLIWDFTNNPKLKKLGSGHQAIAYNHVNKPNTIVKVIRIKKPYKTDPIIDFVQICMDNQNNPFLPRIYTAKLYEINDSNNQNVLIITMEKLHPLTETTNLFDVSFDVFKQLRLFPDEEDTTHPFHDNWNDPSVEICYDIIFEMFHDPRYREWLVNNTPNRYLAKAIRLLDYLFDKYNPDVHSDNIMFRLTSSGPQLVLMDPIII